MSKDEDRAAFSPDEAARHLLSVYSGKSHLGCNLSQQEMAEALVTERKSIPGMTQAMLTFYRKRQGLAADAKVTRRQMVAFLSHGKNLEHCIAYLERHQAGEISKIENLFTRWIVFKESFSQAPALLRPQKAAPKGKFDPEFLIKMTKEIPSEDLESLTRAFHKPLQRTHKGETIEPKWPLPYPANQTAWLIMGSNDLVQVEHMYYQWKALPQGKRPQVIVFSGYGGHGTVYGPIFAHTEADSMSAYFEMLARREGKLEELQKSTRMILERNSTNSGQNAEFVKRVLDRYHSAHPEEPPLEHFVVSGVPPAITRQVLTVEQNFKKLGFPFKTISGFPPSESTIAATYFIEGRPLFSTNLGKPIYQLCALREAATFLDYAVHSDFMAPWHPSLEEVAGVAVALNAAAAKYFAKEKEEGDPYPHIENPGEFASQFIELMTLKVKAGGIPEKNARFIALKNILGNQVKPFSAFFRQAFARVEEETMEVMPPQLKLEEQTKKLLEKE